MNLAQRAKIEEVDLVKATLEDYDFYYNLKCEKTNIYWSGFLTRPDYDGFKDWYENNVIKNKISFYFITHNNLKVGAIYYRIIDENHCNYLGLAVTEKVEGRGIGTLAVSKFLEHIRRTYPKCKIIDVNIRIDNFASQKVHEKLGFRKTGETEDVYLESEGKNIAMEYWRYVFS